MFVSANLNQFFGQRPCRRGFENWYKIKRIRIELSEAITVVYDMTRQPNYDLDNLMDPVRVLCNEYENVKDKWQENMKVWQSELEAELAMVNQNLDDGSDKWQIKHFAEAKKNF